MAELTLQCITACLCVDVSSKRCRYMALHRSSYMLKHKKLA